MRRRKRFVRPPAAFNSANIMKQQHRAISAGNSYTTTLMLQILVRERAPASTDGAIPELVKNIAHLWMRKTATASLPRSIKSDNELDDSARAAQIGHIFVAWKFHRDNERLKGPEVVWKRAVIFSTIIRQRFKVPNWEYSAVYCFRWSRGRSFSISGHFRPERKRS